LLRNEFKGAFGHEGQEEEVLATIGIRRFPFLTVLVTPLERGVEARALLGFVFPHRGPEAIDADFMCGFVGGNFCRFIFAHFIFFLVWLRFAGAFCFSQRPKTNRRQKVQTKPGAIEWRAAEQKAPEVISSAGANGARSNQSD
jgi:hypothetical protein